jgi:hypothetical protein
MENEKAISDAINEIDFQRAYLQFLVQEYSRADSPVPIEERKEKLHSAEIALKSLEWVLSLLKKEVN